MLLLDFLGVQRGYNRKHKAITVWFWPPSWSLSLESAAFQNKPETVLESHSRIGEQKKITFSKMQ